MLLIRGPRFEKHPKELADLPAPPSHCLPNNIGADTLHHDAPSLSASLLHRLSTMLSHPRLTLYVPDSMLTDTVSKADHCWNVGNGGSEKGRPHANSAKNSGL